MISENEWDYAWFSAVVTLNMKLLGV